MAAVDFPTDRQVVVYCKSGYRAAMANAALGVAGWDNVKAFSPELDRLVRRWARGRSLTGCHLTDLVQVTPAGAERCPPGAAMAALLVAFASSPNASWASSSATSDVGRLPPAAASRISMTVV